MKKIHIAIIGLMLFAVFISCTNNESQTSATTVLTEETNTFFASFKKNYSHSISADLRTKGKTRSGLIDSKECINLELTFPENVPEDISNAVKKINCTQDIIIFMRLFGTDLVETDKEKSTDRTIQFSKKEIEKNLKPLSLASRKYLLDIGFTSSEIDNMLKEQSACEEDLIPLVLLLTERNIKIAENEIALNNTSFNPFATTAKAINTSHFLHVTLNCGLEVLGVRELTQIAKGSAFAGKLAKSTIVKLFAKTVAKYAGPIGTALCVADFVWCMVDNHAFETIHIFTNEEVEEFEHQQYLRRKQLYPNYPQFWGTDPYILRNSQVPEDIKQISFDNLNIDTAIVQF